jgi:hypothetical protein
VIANSDAVTHDTRTIGAIFFMRGIMTRKQGPGKPLILMQYDSDDERGSTLVSATLGAEIAARFGPRSESPFSILAYDGDALVGGLNGVTHWGWWYIRHFWVEQSFRNRGVGRRSCKPAHGSASAFTLIHSIRAQLNSMSIVAFGVLVRSMIFHPDTRGHFYTKSCLLAEGARRDR